MPVALIQKEALSSAAKETAKLLPPPHQQARPLYERTDLALSNYLKDQSDNKGTAVKPLASHILEVHGPNQPASTQPDNARALQTLEQAERIRSGKPAFSDNLNPYTMSLKGGLIAAAAGLSLTALLKLFTEDSEDISYLSAAKKSALAGALAGFGLYHFYKGNGVFAPSRKPSIIPAQQRLELAGQLASPMTKTFEANDMTKEAALPALLLPLLWSGVRYAGKRLLWPAAKGLVRYAWKHPVGSFFAGNAAHNVISEGRMPNIYEAASLAGPILGGVGGAMQHANTLANAGRRVSQVGSLAFPVAMGADATINAADSAGKAYRYWDAPELRNRYLADTGGSALQLVAAVLSGRAGLSNAANPRNPATTRLGRLWRASAPGQTGVYAGSAFLHSIGNVPALEAGAEYMQEQQAAEQQTPNTEAPKPTTNKYHGSLSNAPAHAGVGAGIGLLLNEMFSSSKNRRKRMLGAALLGAGLGGAVGVGRGLAKVGQWTYSSSGKTLYDLVRAIQNDPSIRGSEESRLLKEIAEATNNASMSTPLSSLISRGAGGIIGYLIAKYFKLNTAGAIISALAGMSLGKGMFDSQGSNKGKPGWYML